MNVYGTIFEGNVLSSMSSFIRTLFWVIHLIEPVGTACKSSTVKDHTHGKIRVVDVVIERHTPHHNQTSVQMLNLPADCTTRPCGCTRLQIKNVFLLEWIPKWQKPLKTAKIIELILISRCRIWLYHTFLWLYQTANKECIFIRVDSKMTKKWCFLLCCTYL